MRKGKNIFILSLLVGFYLVFRTIFFVFFGNSSVDVLIGCTIFFLFFLIYKKSRYFIYFFLLSLTKNLYLNFFSLFKLLISLRKLVLGYNKIYLEYFRYNLLALRIIFKTLNVIYKKSTLNLLNKLNLKLFFVNSRTSNLPLEYVIRNNFNLELNILISYDILFFIL